MIKRIVAFTLACVLVLTTPINALAETPGGGTGIGIHPTQTSYSPNWQADHGTYQDMGYRITITTNDPMLEENIQPLSGAFTNEDIENKRKEVEDLCRQRYWEPGNYGIYFWANMRRDGVMPHLGIATSIPGEGMNIRNNMIQMASGDPVVTQNDNLLAWMCWNTPDNLNRTPNIPAYNPKIYNIIVGGDSNYANGGDWLYDIKQKYLEATGMSEDARKADNRDRLTRVVSRGKETVKNFQNFSWDTEVTDSGDNILPQQRVMWSFTGYLTMLIQFAWLAQDTGNNATYLEFEKAIWSWVVSGYDPRSMPILQVEACAELDTTGKPTAENPNIQLQTIPYILNNMYGTHMSALLYNKWSDVNCKDNMTETIRQFAGTANPKDNWMVSEALGFYIKGGAVIRHHTNRAYCKKLYPTSDGADGSKTFGYFICYTYYADIGLRTDPDDPPTTGDKTMGSFTWKLKPNGLHDKTPDIEVNEPSTIYDLNISQEGYNSNNYKDWEAVVRGDGIDCNKLRIRIYHVSENLSEDQAATQYARDAVKQRGEDVTTPVNKVTVSPTGNINGFPIGTITELHNNTWSENLTDDQFLKIMKEGWGLTYSESITGKLVNGTTPEGVRVTYAVYVDYDIGCKNTDDKYQLSNNQAEWVEYRSIPGTYIYQSNAPTGFAEIKCGYFNREEGYYENFEAMAGMPTTEDLYFVSGGQDFVAQIQYEYIGPQEQDQNPEIKNAIRNYEQGYSSQTCAGYYYTLKYEGKNETPETAIKHDFFDKLIEGENMIVCSECGYKHYAGAGGSEKAYETEFTLTGDVKVTFPGGGKWEVYDIEESSWDWTAPAIEKHCTDACKENPDGSITHSDCEGATENTVEDTGTQPDALKCSCGAQSSAYVATKARKFNFKVRASHIDFNNGNTSSTDDKTVTANQANIKFKQTFKDIRYAKIKDVHVWRLERSRMEGIRQLTFENDDFVFGEADSYADAVFNVAEDDTALEGRMFYSLHPEDGDNFKFKTELPTRGCCHCYVHNAAEDLIKTNENMVANDATPATQLEEGWVISDYLVLKGTQSTTSLLYAQYQSRNKDANKYPILNIRVSGTDQQSRQDNGYEYLGADNQWHKITYDTRETIFETQTIDYNAPITTGNGGSANANDGTLEKLCENPETFKGGHVSASSLAWGGYNGDYKDTEADTHGAYGVDELDQVGKYQGRAGVDNWKGEEGKKIFEKGYQHLNQGEVENSGFNTASPQSWTEPENPFILVSEPIDVHDIKVYNGEKDFTNSTIFYNNIISYSSNGTGSPIWSEEEDAVYQQRGFHVDTNYYEDHDGINSIIIHNPVSAQYAGIIALPSELDQRVDGDLIVDSLNQDNSKCPGTANACAYAELHCNYDGTWYHTEDCYAEIRGNGLATVPVEGDIHTEMRPVEHGTKNTGTMQFGYTGARQTFEAPLTGYYHFDVYGAQGGVSAKGGSGGKGAYVSCDVYLKQGEKLYLYVGGMGGQPDGGYNGGGKGGPGGGGGGGMSSVSLHSGSYAAMSNYMQGQGLSKTYQYPHETKWMCTDGQWRDVSVDPGNATNFTLYSNHDYYLAFTNKHYQEKGWWYLYDESSGICLSTGRRDTPEIGKRYPLDKFANPINQMWDSGFTRNSGWDQTLWWLLAAAGGGGSGPANGGAGGLNGEDGAKRQGYAGKGATTTGEGAGGAFGGYKGWEGSGGSNYGKGDTAGGGGGGGAGWYGGGAGGYDYGDSYIDDSGGGGGSSFMCNETLDGNPRIKNGTVKTGDRVGNGFIQISWNIDTTYTTYEPVITGSLTYDKDAAEVIPTEFKPHIFTAPTNGYYSFHLYGSAGGGTGTPGGNQGSQGGKGGYAAGQLYLTQGQQVLVTCGGQGSHADLVGAAHSGGYNGGGNSNSEKQSGGQWGGFGGGGATDIATNFFYQAGDRLNTNQTAGSMQNNRLYLPNEALYWGPRMTTYKDHIYRVDIYGENLDKAIYEAHGYIDGKPFYNNCTLLHSYITPQHMQLFYRVDTQPDAGTQEFQIKGTPDGVYISEVFIVDMADRVLVAGGGGGADDPNGVAGGHNDGSGGDGGGEAGTPGLNNGVPLNNAANATTGYLPGIGQDSTGKISGYVDMGGGGAGWYGGYMGQGNNAGGGGGSGKIGNVTNGKLLTGQNTGSGYAVIVYPGKGDADGVLQLACKEPHHAPNSNMHLYTQGWKHEGGFTCEGVGCPFCANGKTLYTPTGFGITESMYGQLYVVQHDGELHLTHGSQLDPQNDMCDTCGTYPTVDTYTIDGVNKLNCSWLATTYDAACYETRESTNPEYHYSFGDDTCYDPCMDDNNHKKNPVHPDEEREEAGKFVILDYDFQVYFPNLGDYYGNGALGLGNTQKPEGFGYYGGRDGNDPMDTTKWLKEKYVMFPFDVTYKGKTYLSGERIMLGTYDESTNTWYDDAPTSGDQAYKYTFHCLLNNSEWAAANVLYVAVAKNTPVDPLESRLEDHNYTRYGDKKRAYHDAFKEYYIDVVGRIGVLSILDTGDFRFSNYYKQATDGWKVDQVVHDVDLSKQNYVSIDTRTIFNDPISAYTKGQNTWGLTDWAEPIDKLRPFPLTPGENNVKALRNQAHRIGYSDYMSLVTVGNYYGENDYRSNNEYRVQIQPFYYYYNLETKEWTPVDVYIRQDGDSYKMINDYGSTQSTTEYNFFYDLNWETEAKRRMYTAEEENISHAVQQNYYYSTATDDEQVGAIDNIRLPHGIKYLHGTANMLFLRDRNRTFIGTRNRYGVNTETDNRIPEIEFNRQAQRWHFTLGLPSTATFVKQGEPCTPENIAKYDMEEGIIVVALDIKSKGTVWTLGYSGTPVGERSFYLFDNNTTKVSWEDAGPNGPEDRVVVLVYTNSETSRNDLTTEGTH